MRPSAESLAKYESIFVGEVTGIRLLGYENKKLGKPDACEIEKDGSKGLCFNLIGGNEPVAIFALPEKVFAGRVTGVQELDQAGCNYTNLTLKERGIFFVNPGGRSAVVVWQSHGQEFDIWLKRLGGGENGR